MSTAQAANLFSYCQVGREDRCDLRTFLHSRLLLVQMAFMAGRFISVPILHFVHPTLMLGIFGSCCCLFAILTSQVSGTAGAVMVFLVFFFESICYPVVSFQCYFTELNDFISSSHHCRSTARRCLALVLTPTLAAP